MAACECVAQDSIIQQSQKDCEGALRTYFQRLGEQNQQKLVGENKEAFVQGYAELKQPRSDVAQENLLRDIWLQQSLRPDEGQAQEAKQLVKVEDSDGEEVSLCHQCNMPLGEKVYRRDRRFFHGECMAQFMVRDMKDDATAREKKEQEEKQACRKEYGIGWDASHVPRNDVPAGKVAMRQVQQGMICLVLDQETETIRIASTSEPAAAINLEYLSTSLEVRRREGHEPVFSLDPVDPTDRDSMQAKVFVPDWLAGTSVGEVLFQADFHLKELSMGEYAQPVVGMKSCFDYSEMDGSDFTEWSAREWFLVRKAEVQASDSNVLIPYVKMGVEAREQVVGGKGIQDKQITRPDHPMVKYAEAFTKNFDLIAERKSVIYHLRELAKASVLAKHLLDSAVPLDESWFHLAAEKEFACSLEVPQLWNHRLHSEVKVQDGAIVPDNEQKNSHMHGVYGGVAFGLDKFNLAASVSRVPPLSAAAGKLAVSASRGPTREAPLAGSVAAGKFNLALSVARAVPGAAVAPTPLAAGVPLAKVSPFAAAISAGPLPVPAREAPSMALSIARQVPGAAVSPGAPALAAAALERLPATARMAALERPTLATTVARDATLPAGLPQRVTFGLSRKAGVAPISTIAAMATGMAFQPPAAAMAAPPGAVPARTTVVAPRPLAATAAPRLQGVDLRLDNFDLSDTKRMTLEKIDGKSLDECVTIGDAFWSSLDDDSSHLESEDRDLLKQVFNPELSDRRREGDLFAPPDASYATVTRLRGLLKEEEKVRQRRKEHFFSKAFEMSSPSSLFPATWVPSFETNMSEARQGTLCPRPEYTGQATALLQQVLKTSVPIFDRITEEGLRFVIYQLGSLEVRTTQDASGEEIVGAVFSIRPAKTTTATERHIGEEDKIVKATEYVERVFAEIRKGSNVNYYVVFETERGQKIVTECLSDGTVTWEEDAGTVEDRNSFAKVTRSTEETTCPSVRELVAHRATSAEVDKASPSVRKRCARAMYDRAVKSNKQR